MQAGSWITADVQLIKTRILVNGIERPHATWDIDREISGDLPAQVAYGSGLRQATGTVVWASSQDIATNPAPPWNSFNQWVPKRGDRVEVWAGSENTSYCQFTGVLDKTTGSIGGGDFQSTIIDDYDRGSTRIQHAGLMANMFPYNSGGSFRGVGLTHTYYVDRAFRAAGFYVTPPAVNSVLDVPCQGGMWPFIGEPVTAETATGASYPSNHYAPWGFCVSNFFQTFIPDNPRTASQSLQLSFLVAPTHAGFYYMRASYGSTYVQLSINNEWGVTAIIGGTTVTGFALAGKGGLDGRIVTMVLKSGTVTIRSNNGQSATGTAAFSGSTLMSQISISGQDGVRIAGIQVSHPTAPQEFAPQSFKPSAVINTANVSLMGVMVAAPHIVDRTANDLIDEISQASLSAVWIDETGVMRWWPALSLQAVSPRATLTTRNDVFDLDWEDSLLSSASRVTIKHQTISLKISRFQNLRLYIGSGGTLESGEISEDVVEPDQDETWYGVAETPTILRSGNWEPYNRRRGTYMGGYFSASGATTSDAGLIFSAQLIRRSMDSYLARYVVGTLPEDVVFNASTSPADPSLWDMNRDKPLLELGGHARARWTDSIYSPEQVGGAGPDMEHDTGVWVPVTTVPNVFNYLSGQTATPHPAITGLDVVFDPRRQVGDVVLIESERLMGVTLRVLITGVSTSASPSGINQSLTVRVMSVSRKALTYAEFDRSLPGTSLTYAQWQALGPLPQSYTEFNDS